MIQQLMCLGFVIYILYSIAAKIKEQATIQDVKRKALLEEELSVEQFYKLKKVQSGFAGVYILYNTHKHLYYVGQSRDVFKRVAAHFQGRGNGDVYADYKYGDVFTIRLFALHKSGYDSLDLLEYDLICGFDGYQKGYNKSKGRKRGAKK